MNIVSKLLSVTCRMLFAVAMIAILSGPIIMIWQSIHWSLTSEWIPVPMEKLMALLGLEASSVPGLGQLPLTQTMPTLGVLFMYLAIFPLLFPLIQTSEIARQKRIQQEDQLQKADTRQTSETTEQPQRFPITAKHTDGKKYSGEYEVRGSSITVHANHRQITTQLEEGSDARKQAKIHLRQIIAGGAFDTD
jgi:hypothetical protein